MSWTFRRYDPAACCEWDKFVAESRNATFIHLRGYMDYHSDRFEDFSLLAYKNGKLLSILPANIVENAEIKELVSHGGLTYGGWLLPPTHLDAPDFMEMWTEWIKWCKGEGFTHIDYRPVPVIYHRAPSGEDVYALWRSNAVMSECNLSAAIDLDNNPGLNKMRRRHLKHFKEEDYIIERCENLTNFHHLLSNCLEERHGASPVHDLKELELLTNRFPRNIEIWTISQGETLMAGICLYISPTACHCQYIATSPEGRTGNFLTPLIVSLIHKAIDERKRYFDFGTSNEKHGEVLNQGLIRQKNSYGATGVPYLKFRLDLSKSPSHNYERS